MDPKREGKKNQHPPAANKMTRKMSVILFHRRPSYGPGWGRRNAPYPQMMSAPGPRDLGDPNLLGAPLPAHLQKSNTYSFSPKAIMLSTSQGGCVRAAGRFCGDSSSLNPLNWLLLVRCTPMSFTMCVITPRDSNTSVFFAIRIVWRSSVGSGYLTGTPQGT